MSSYQSTTNRRTFLKASVAFTLLPKALVQNPIERGRFSETDLPFELERLLKLINEERAQFQLSQLKLDGLACQIAREHARDMASGRFLSHWGRDGRKPYHRYSLAGGTDAVQENVSSADNIQSLTATGVATDLSDMQLMMFNEVAPHDGHRRAILFPQHTHVGLGIALVDRALRLDELYLTRYVQVDPLPRDARPGESLMLRGRLLNTRHELKGIDVYYEPLPSPPVIEWLRVPRSYGMPLDYERLLPRLPERTFYPDGSSGSIQVKDGRFRAPVVLSKKSGINTIVVWIRTSATSDSFPATQVCIRCE